MADYPYMPDLDEATAIGMALADVLDGLEWAAGHRLRSVFAGWADPEDIKQPPAVAVLPFKGQYVDRAPKCLDETRSADGGTVLFEDGEFVADVPLVIWATTPTMRALVTRSVREALQQRDPEGAAIFGRTIAVPRYFGGARVARVAPAELEQEDSEASAMSRNRVAYMTVGVRLPILRAESVRDLLPRFVLEVTEADGAPSGEAG